MQDGRWVVIDVQEKRLVDEIHDLNDCICAMQFSPNGHSLAIGTKSGIIHLYQVSEDGSKYNRIGRCTEDGTSKKLRSSSTGGSPVNFLSNSNSSVTFDWSDDSCFIRANAQEASLSFCKLNISLFLAEQIGIHLGRLGNNDILLPCRLDAILISESRNL